MRVECLLWDFGGTLCDERSLWRSSPEWIEVYRSFDLPDGIGAAWSLGELDTQEVAAKLAQRMSLTEAGIHAHLCRSDLFAFFFFTYAFFRARHLPQAIVTVNPVQFRAMAEDLRLGDVSEAIVISAEEETIDRGALCEIALQRIRISCPNARALLIDNKASNIDAWADRGGIGYRYTSDAAFRRDVANGIDGLLRYIPRVVE
jgi:hypothetical protein